MNVQLAQRGGFIPKLIWTGDVQNSTAPLDMFLCCSFLNPTLNGSSLSLLADTQGLCIWMSLKTVIDDFFFSHSFLSTARLNLCGKYKGATWVCSNMLIIKFSWKTNARSRGLWCLYLQHTVSFKMFLSFVVVNNCLTLRCLKILLGVFTLGA